MDLPHVTDILREAGMVDDRFFTDFARERGTAVHRAIQYLLEGDLDRGSLDPVVSLRLTACERLLDEADLEVLACEEAVVDKNLGYCGTLDLRCLLNGREAVIDFKNGGPAPWHGPQLAAYARTFGRPLERWTCHLYDNSYHLRRHNSREDWPVFAAALTLWHWRVRWTPLQLRPRTFRRSAPDTPLSSSAPKGWW